MTPEETLISYQKTLIEKWVSRDPLVLQEILDFFHPNFSGFGSGLHEITENREEWVQMMNKEQQEVPASPIVELAWLKAKTINHTGYTWGIFHLKVPADGQFLEMKNWRFSVTWVKEKDWKAIHMHTSVPWVMQQEGESYPIEELQARNRELEKMVAEKTADLVKKNRALKVEMALERVRSQTMAMHKSEELSQVVEVMFNEFQQFELTNRFTRVVLTIIDEDKDNGDVELWITGLGGSKISTRFEFNYFDNEQLKEGYLTFKEIEKDKRKEFKYITMHEGKDWEDLLAFAKERKQITSADLKMLEEAGITQWIEHSVGYAYGSLSISRDTPLSDDVFNILQRFAAVFEQTYTRFLDLQKAEAQAKEAQIEAALERVRAQTMAMHKSEELSRVAEAMFKEFDQLGLTNELTRILINIIDEDSGDTIFWMTTMGGGEISTEFKANAFEHEAYEAEFQAFQNIEKHKRKEHKYTNIYEGETFDEWIAFLLDAKIITPEDVAIKNEKGVQKWVENNVMFSHGILVISRDTPLLEEDFNILQRFAAVFEQTYTRFLDLQKAEQQAREIEKVFNENQRLLHSILPVEVVKELLETGSVKPARFDEVSILFSDFKEFTNIVATIPTRKLINELNELFSEFDDIMEAEGIEKIQTVGDAYLAASGLPEEVPDHAIRCVRAAKKMIDFLNRRNETSAIKWKIRIGIHSGPIAAGVVGKKKFAYDIFGDTINTASRIETAGEEGKINVSAYTYDLIKDQFPCEYRGKISAKGKGDLDMYFVK